MRNLVGVVLAAGEGQRLRPLTELRPKALCPINNTPLLDLAVARVRRHVAEVAVNAHHLAHHYAHHRAPPSENATSSASSPPPLAMTTNCVPFAARYVIGLA